MMKSTRLFYVLVAGRYVVCALIYLLYFGQTAFSGELSDFEQDATSERNEKEKNHNNHDSDDDDDGFFDSLFDIFFEFTLGAGGDMSMDRIRGVPTEWTENLKPRRLGEAMIPFFRSDAAYQNVIGDISAFDIRGEIGYGPLGFQVRNTHYREIKPADKLDFLQIHGLYRMSFGNNIEVDLGLGSSSLHGKERHSGFSLTTPILVHPNEVIGFELRPSWTDFNENWISDWDFGMDLKYHYAAFRIGYRWVQSTHESLDGPYIGVSFRI